MAALAGTHIRKNSKPKSDHARRPHEGAEVRDEQGAPAGLPLFLHSRLIQRKCACASSSSPCSKCQEEEGARQLQMKERHGHSAAPAASARPAPFGGAGHALPGSVAVEFGPRLGSDLSSVRIHTDASTEKAAERLNARAFTAGKDIGFGRGEYEPDSGGGRLLLAHELAHVVQQSGGAGRVPAAAADYAGFETEADGAAEIVAKGGSVRGLTAVTPGRIQAQPAGNADAGVAPAPALATDVAGGTPDAGTAPATPVAGPPLPAPKGSVAITIDGVDVYDDKDYMRHRFEQLVIEQGQSALDQFLWHFRTTDAMVGGDLDTNNRVRAMVEEVADELDQDRSAFLDRFEEKAKENARKTLDKSEAEEQAEALRYGIDIKTVEYQVADCLAGDCTETKTSYSMGGDTPALTGMRAAANTLLERHNWMNSAWLDVVDAQKIAEDAEAEASDGAGVEVAEAMNNAHDHLDDVMKNYQAEKDNYDLMRGYVTEKYPILAAFSDPDKDISGLQSLVDQAGPGDEMAGLLGAEIVKRLANIAKVRRGLNSRDDVNTWRLPELVAVTGIMMGADADPLKKRWVERRVEDEQPGIWESLALLVLNIVAIVLAGPTGGLSLAVAAGVNAVVAAQHIQEYQMQKALSGTAFDKAKALSQEDPSFFWLAVEVVGVAFDAVTAFKEISEAVKVVRAAQEANDAVRIGEEMEHLKDVARTHGGEALANRVVAQISEGGETEAQILKAMKVTETEESALGAEARAMEEELKAGVIEPETAGPIKISAAGHIYVCHSPCEYLLEKYKELLGVEISLEGETTSLRSQYLAFEHRASKVAEDVKAAEAAEKAGTAKPGQLDAAKQADKALKDELADFDAKLAAKKATQLEPDSSAKLLQLDKEGLKRMATLDQDALGRIAKTDADALKKFAALPEDALKSVGQLSEAQMKAIGALDADALGRLANLDPAALAKFADLPADAVNNLAKLDQDALRELGKLDPAALNQLENAKDLNVAKRVGSGEKWTGSGKEPKWADPKSKAYRHVIGGHSSELLKTPKTVWEWMKKFKAPQGIWRDNSLIPLAEQMAPKFEGSYVIEMGRDVGDVFELNGTITKGVTKFFLRRGEFGELVSAYPVSSSFTF
jgi:Domain of unknown function (DUF4157)